MKVDLTYKEAHLLFNLVAAEKLRFEPISYYFQSCTRLMEKLLCPPPVPAMYGGLQEACQ